MEAEQVWKVWRRLLREPALYDRLFLPDFSAAAASFGLSPEETRIVMEYARTPEAVRWGVETYRYRLVSGVLYSVSAGAPMTWKLLAASGQDLRASAQEHLEATGWEDDGPFLYRKCSRYLEHVARQAWARAVPCLADTLALEARVLELTRRVASAPSPPWPAPAQRAAPAEWSGATFRQTGTGVLVSTEHQLTPWLMDPSQVGQAVLVREPQHLLAWLPSAEEDPSFCALGESAKVVFALLERPRPYPELRAAMRERGEAEDALTAVLGMFLDMGVVRVEGVHLELEPAEYVQHIGMRGDFSPRPRACELCGHESFMPIREWAAVEGGYKVRLPVVSCKRCGYLMQNPRFSREFYREYYASHYRRVLLGDSEPTQDFIDYQLDCGERLYQSLERSFERPGEVLDVGSSCGGMLEAFMRRGWKALGIDPDAGYVRHGQALGFPVTVMEAEEMRLEPGRYDFIMIMGASLEHVDDPNVVLRLCRQAARPGALLLVEGWALAQARLQGRLTHNHRRYLTARSAELLMLKHGWSPLLTTHRELCGPSKPGSLFCLGRVSEVPPPSQWQALIDQGGADRPQELKALLDALGVGA